MTYSLIKIGSDAELFVQKEGKAFPICGIVGGTKEQPLPVLGGNGYAVQEDNVMLEFNIPPAGSAEAFEASIVKILAYLKTEMGNKGLALTARSSMLFDDSHLQSEQAKKFGCEPDYCVWSRSVNAPPSPAELMSRYRRNYDKTFNGELRSAGYHIHASYTVNGEKPELDQIENFVKAQDLFLGVPSMLLDELTGPLRRKSLYGKAGCFRPKEYGHEYRVLGSRLLGAKPAVHSWIFRQMHKVVEFLNTHNESQLSLTWANHGGYIQEAINTGDLNYINAMITSYKIEMPPGIGTEWHAIKGEQGRMQLECGSSETMEFLNG